MNRKKKNKKTENYSPIAKSFHWVTAVLIIFLLGLGLYMVGLDYSDTKMELYGLHKSLGAVVLLVIACRLLWRITHNYPEALETHKKWEHFLAKAAHVALYVVAFLMPMSGWLMSQSYGYPVPVFGLIELPVLVDKDVIRGEFLAAVHFYLGYTLIGLIGLHVLGALKHHFLDSDNTLRRMLPFAR